MAVLRHALVAVTAILGTIASPTKELVRRAGVQTDLSGGWCRSNFLASNLAGDTLRFTGLDGGILPGAKTSDSDILYLVEVDVSKKTDLSDGENYKLSLWDDKMIKLKDQAFYSNNKNDTFYLFGGRALGGALSDDGIWEYYPATKKWERQQTGVRPVRVGYGAHINVPEVQAGFWVGGARNTDTSPEIQDDTNFYPIGMTVYNTTTREIRNLTDTPFGPTQYGGLVHVPVETNDMGSLIYIGGERPDEPEKVKDKYTFTIASWETVWVFDIARQVWYEQETSGDIPPARTQFCAVTAYDSAPNGTHHIYILGGASFDTKEMQYDIYALAVPSFRWYKTGSLPESRMSHRCEIRGPNVFMIGGRRKFADGYEEGCFPEAISIWDLNTQEKSVTYDPSNSQYTALILMHNDIANNPKPEKWASQELEDLYFVSELTANEEPNIIAPISDRPVSTSKNSSLAPGAIAGLVIGAVLVLSIAVLIIVLHRRRKAAAAARAMDDTMNAPLGWGMKYELDPGSRADSKGPVELSGHGKGDMYATMVEADSGKPLAELGGPRVQSVRYEMDAGPLTPKYVPPARNEASPHGKVV